MDAMEITRYIFDCIPACIWLKDRENRMIRVNRFAADCLGKTPEEMEGHHTEEFYPRHAIKYWADDLEVIRSGTAKRGIIEPLITKGGERRWVRTDKLPYRNDKGEVIGVLVFSIDITERMLVEEELRHKTIALEQSNRDLEHFARIASHDMQEPLRMVNNYVELIDKQFKDALGAQGKEYLDFAHEGLTRMREMIDDLLEYSAVGKRDLQTSSCNALDAVEAALHNLKAQKDEAEATVEISPLPHVLANSKQLVRLFQNLLSNAFKYRSQRPLEVKIRAERRNDEWLFSVEDNGIGIEDKDRDRIFQLFQRLHGRGEYPGSGMGLAIAKKIVEMHGGRIWVASRPGEGSCFYFTLPPAPATTGSSPICD